MRAKIREILDDCIADGLRTGYGKAHKYEDSPCEETLIANMEVHIWFEIDRHFDFEQCATRNVCDEKLKGKTTKREWVGLTWAEMVLIINLFHAPAIAPQLCRAIEAKLKEKNT